MLEQKENECNDLPQTEEEPASFEALPVEPAADAAPAKAKREMPAFPVLAVWTVLLLLALLAVWFCGLTACSMRQLPGRKTRESTGQATETEAGAETQETGGAEHYPYRTGAKRESYLPVTDDQTAAIGGQEFDAAYAILLDLQTGRVLASRNADERIYPASMTKVMSLLVVCDWVTDLEDTITVPADVPARMKQLGASTMDLDEGEVVSVSTLLYGMVLKSGGDAAVLLARYVAGSEERFVELMNEKASQMGLTQTHFANCTGLHDDAHYSTCREMAAIFTYAYDNELAFTVLTTAQKTAPSNYQGKDFNYYFKAGWYENFVNHGLSFKVGKWEIVGGKTGYTADTYDEEGNLQKNHCLGTYARSGDGGALLALTAGGTQSQKQRAEDAIYIYQNYAGD